MWSLKQLLSCMIAFHGSKTRLHFITREGYYRAHNPHHQNQIFFRGFSKQMLCEDKRIKGINVSKCICVGPQLFGSWQSEELGKRNYHTKITTPQ